MARARGIFIHRAQRDFINSDLAQTPTTTLTAKMHDGLEIMFMPRINFTRTFSSALVFAVILVGCGAPKFKARKIEHGHLYERDGVWILELDGAPAERGHAAGQLVGEQIRWALPRYLRATLRTDTPEGLPLKIIQKLRDSIPRAHLEQLNALAESSGVDRDLLLAVNLAPEVWAGLACSCLAVTAEKSADGAPLLARNLDWYGGDVLKDLGLLVIEPGLGRKFASLSYPGLVGVVTGMNSQGLSVANLVVLGQNAVPAKGVPVTFALRRILEEHDTVQSAVDYLSGIERTVPQNYAFADRTMAVVLETWTRRFRRRDPKGGFVALGNLFDEDKKAHPKSRYPKMMRAGQQPTLDVEALKKALRDVALGEMNVHAAIFAPATLTLYGSTQSRPAASGPFWKMDLGPLLSH